MKSVLIALWTDERAFRLTLRALVMAASATVPQIPALAKHVPWLVPVLAGIAMLIPAGELNPKQEPRQ